MAQPGDIIVAQGTLLPKMKQSFEKEPDLLFTSYMEAFTVETQKKKYSEISLSPEEEQ